MVGAELPAPGRVAAPRRDAAVALSLDNVTVARVEPTDDPVAAATCGEWIA